MSAAAEEIDRVGQAALSELRPVTYGRGVQFATITLAEEVTRGVRPTLMLLLGAVGLVLAIACVNVTNLLVGRGARRRGELALRAALGANRNRLVRQLLTESLLLAFVGGLLGVVVAILGVRVLVALVPAGVPRVDDIRVDVVVLAGAVGISALVGLGVGLIPAVQAARRDAQRGLYLGASRGYTGHRRFRGTLVVVEVALALVLLASSGLLYRSLQRLFAVPMGFDSSGVLTLQVQAASRRFDNPVATQVFFEQVLEAVRRVPSVASAAYTSQLPLSGDRAEYGVTLEASPNEGYSSFVYAVSPGYVETMRIPVRSGRTLEQRDDADAPRVALVSEALARRRFGGGSPLGRRVRIGPPDSALYTIVGVVADTKQLSLAMDEAAAVYTTAGQWRQDERAMSVVVRTVGSRERMAPGHPRGGLLRGQRATGYASRDYG